MKKEKLKGGYLLLKTKRFSMVEIAFTLVVVVIGIVGLIALYPVGLNSQKQAIGTSFANDAGEHFLRLSVAKIQQDWAWINAYKDTKPGSDEPRQENWSNDTLVHYKNIRITPTSDFNPELESNSGFFLLEQLTDDKVDLECIVRAWKTVTEHEGNAKSVVLHVELSFPAEIPYDSPNRIKNTFSLEVYKPPQFTLVDTAYNNCTITKIHGDTGYATTLTNVDLNGDDTYTISLVVEYSGCSGVECPELSDYAVEADVGTYSDVYISGVSGDFDLGPELTSVAFEGFEVTNVEDIGDEVGDGFSITYVLDALQDQQVAAVVGENSEVVTFSVSEFEYILMNCSSYDEPDDDTPTDSECPDVVTDITHTLDPTASDFEVKFFCEDIEIRAQGENDITALEFRSKDGVAVSQLITNIQNDWAIVAVPADIGAMGDIRVKQNGTWSSWIVSDASCGSYNENPPVFQNPTFTRSNQQVNEYFCIGLGSSNVPTDADGDTLTYTLNGPSWLYWNEENQQIAGTPDSVGTFTWTISVSDGCHTAQADLTLTVDP